jgi:hypothetical protein
VERLVAYAERLSGGSNAISTAYRRAAWITLAVAVLVWQPFALAALGFYLAAILLKREGL